MGKADLKPIAKAYFRTLRDHSTGKMSLWDVAFQIGLPVPIGVLVCFLGRLGIIGCLRFDGIVTVVSIVSSLMCALAIMLFDLRRNIKKKPDKQAERLEMQLVDELFADVMWCIVSGFSSAVLMALSGLGEWPDSNISLVFGSIAISLALNFAIVSCMCLKRMSGVYLIVSNS